jgi:hypothetical protein
MDAKAKWWERSAQARTKTTGSKKSERSADPANKPPPPSSTSLAADATEADDDGGGGGGGGSAPAAAAAAVLRPGAVAVPGPGFDREREGGGATAFDDDDDNNDPPHPGEEDDDDEVLRVDSYVVGKNRKNRRSSEVEVDEDELRRRILAGTARAELVVSNGAGPSPEEAAEHDKFRQTLWLAGAVVAATLVAAAIAVGIAVPLTAAARQQSTSGAQGPRYGDDVVAALRYMELQGSGGFAYAVRAETISTSASTATTSGALEMVWCKAKPCTESDTNCVVGKYYEPGCCVGANCTEESKCGELCPQPPESCYLKDPNNATCFTPECYTCNQVDGEDMYVVNYFAASVDCLEVGTAVRPENGETYQWAIFCGPVIAGPKVEENRDLGEYQCGAFRIGANYSDDDGGEQAASFPCQYVALAECGCGPADTYTFGLPDPTGPCQPDNCPILCEDSGPQHARNLCRSFPGNISYWEGQNAFNISFFGENVMGSEYELDIYIKGIDSPS